MRVRSGLRRRWVHWDNDQRIMHIARQVEAHAPPAFGSPVVMFNASTRLTGLSLNAAFQLLTAWALRLQGVPVVQFVCQAGMSRCVLGTDRDDPSILPPCADCKAQSRRLFTHLEVNGFRYRRDDHLAEALANLDLEHLTAFEWQGRPLGALVLPSLRWILRRHHLADNEATRKLYREYILSAWHVQREFEDLLERFSPRCVVVFNGMFYPEAVVRRTAQQRDIRVISHEVGLQPYSAFFTAGEATAYPIYVPEEFELTNEQNALLDDYLQQRFQGNFSMAGIRFWPEMRGLSADFIAQAARFRQIVPVFTNVIFDTSQGHANTIFPHMFAWLDQALEIVREHPDTLFVFRAHPDEGRQGKESRESVREWADKRRLSEMPNVRFVDAGEYFSSYELIERAKFVMVYNSTIGLEASLLGTAVLCGGRARFTQLPTVYFPETADEYRRLAEEFLSRPGGKIEAPVEFRRNARRFLYYQLFLASLPFERYLEEDGVWRGYVRLKPFDWEDLLPERSATMRAILDGILHGGNFLLEKKTRQAV